MKIDVIIPVYHPKKEFRTLLKMLFLQTVKPSKIILMNTQDSKEDTKELVEWLSLETKKKTFKSVANNSNCPEIEIKCCPVKKEEFDHGRTRHLGAMKSDADYLLFMTQDAVPADYQLIERLMEALLEENTAVVYARQLAKEDAGIIEAYTRIFNYPSTKLRKTKKDIVTMGIKAYFCSDVCAMYRRDIYEQMGGFSFPIIFGEDMLFAAKLLQEGYAINYAADAKVIHSHEYTCFQQFQRNFDIGVAQAEHPEVYALLPAEKEGIRLVKQTFQFLTSRRNYWMAIYLLFQSGAKYIGYLLGKKYWFLPKKLLPFLSSNTQYWKDR